MLTTSVVYADQWMTLRRDETERRDGFRGSYAYVQKRNFALIIPAENGGFHLVEETATRSGGAAGRSRRAASRTTSRGRPRNWPGWSLPRRPACGRPGSPSWARSRPGTE